MSVVASELELFDGTTLRLGCCSLSWPRCWGTKARGWNLAEPGGAWRGRAGIGPPSWVVAAERTHASVCW